ncbi:MAG: V-type ATP synthase subunit E [Dehalococcoidales bacterium]
MSIDNISKTILEKARLEAKEIVSGAELKAAEKRAIAAKKRQLAFEEARNAIIAEAETEAALIKANAAIEVRKELSIAKAKAIDLIISKIKENLSGLKPDSANFRLLAKNAAKEMGTDSVILYVKESDAPIAKQLVAEDKELEGKVKEIRTCDCLGGIKIESLDGRNLIDNTYDARLGMLMPTILPQISKDLLE